MHVIAIDNSVFPSLLIVLLFAGDTSWTKSKKTRNIDGIISLRYYYEQEEIMQERVIQD